MQSAPITTLIFDFDGVFTIDEYRGIKRICPNEDIIETLETPYYVTAKSDTLWDQYRSQFHLDLTNQELIHIYNEETPDQIAYKKMMMEYVKTLSPHFSLALFSNQMTDRANYLRQHEDFSTFDQLFFSNEIGYKKPDKAAFQYILSQLKKRPEECVFIDDRAENTAAASSLGMQVHTFTDLQSLQLWLKLVKRPGA